MAPDGRALRDLVPPELIIDVVGDAGDGADDVGGANGVAASIVDLTHDSRQVEPAWAFACVVGEHLDGHEYAAEAVERGATLLLVERVLPLDVPQLLVTDVRRAMGPASAVVHGHPASRLELVGITGTNGKTTTTHLMAAILRAAGRNERQMGTLSGARTTPEAPDLQRRLAGYVADQVDAVVMEVSSHALALHRVEGAVFDVAVFTNLGRDHLDLHESMEAYFRAKAELFTQRLSTTGVTNLDDPYGRLLLDVAAIDMVGYAQHDARDVVVGVGHHSFTWRGQPIHVPLGGRFNVMNTLAALTASDVLGIDAATAAAGLLTCRPVPGRFEVVTDPDVHDFAVVVDYAHTPDGLVEVLLAARALTETGRVIVVFGCGGDRDSAKRPLMGAAAADHADQIVITSDNPRHEDPMAIIAAAVDGIALRYRDRVVTEVDRRIAISDAVHEARAGDVVVIAGKGHEITQTTGDTAHPFDDRIVAREALETRVRDERGVDT